LFEGRLALPLIAAPMFIVSYPELVIACCKAGIAGTFPSLNARTPEDLDAWLARIEAETKDAAPFGVNLIVHKTNPRLAADLALCARHKVPFVITSVGEPSAVVDAVHAYGGIVFHDVTNIRHAKKALAAGVDGLILVAAGAGGHAGTLSPFALVSEVRQFYAGPVVLSGAISRGNHIRAAELMGADFAYMGTRLIATAEAHAAPGYKQMLVDATAEDILYTPAFTGVPGNYLKPSIAAAGLDPDNIAGAKDKADLALDKYHEAKTWKDIWGAGQGVGAITDVPTVADLVARLKREYDGIS
jgi:nitronate monooxygenase